MHKTTVIRYLFQNQQILSNNFEKMSTHIKCRNTFYPNKSKHLQVQRFTVPNDKVDWNADWLEYDPTELTVNNGKSWEDPPIEATGFNPLWNQLDHDIDRSSFHGPYRLLNGTPLNVVGRTGIKGRGCLGRWGPNHAADPIVTRWKRYTNGGNVVVNPNSNKPVLQFVAIQRKDCEEWAIPGGMVDPNEDVSNTLKREFCEEAVNSLSLTDNQKAVLNLAIGDFFKSGVEVCQGYVDDPRNTDNAWMETVVRNFHDSTGKTIGQFSLCAGDDAAKVQWMDISQQIKLYASHASFLEATASLLDAHW